MRRESCLGFLAQGDAAEIAALNRERGPFDLLLTTDTLYDRTTQPLLADTIAALAAPHTTVLVASPVSLRRQSNHLFLGRFPAVSSRCLASWYQETEKTGANLGEKMRRNSGG